MFKNKTALWSKTFNKTCQNAPQVVNSAASLRRGGQINYLYVFIVMCSTLFGVFAPAKGWGQNASHCGEFHKPTQPDPNYGGPTFSDRFGNNYTYEELAIPTNTNTTLPPGTQAMGVSGCDCNTEFATQGINLEKFDLYFEDCQLGNGVGFNDLTLGSDRRLTACQVYQYLETIINQNSSGCSPAPSKVNVKISSYTDPTTPLSTQSLGWSSAFLPDNESELGYHEHLPWLVLNAYGNYNQVVNNYFANIYHSSTVINFGFNWGAGNTAPNNTEYSLYSMFLHHALHSLGFYTQIADFGTFLGSSATSNPIGGYSRWDGLLYDPATAQPIIEEANPSFPYEQSTTLNNTNPFIGGCGATRIGSLGLNVSCTPSIYNSTIYEPNVLNHLEGNSSSCTGTSNMYSSNPQLFPGDFRPILEPEEINLLAELGYSVTLPSGSTSCSMGGVNDYNITGFGCPSVPLLASSCAGQTVSFTIEGIMANDLGSITGITDVLPIDFDPGLLTTNNVVVSPSTLFSTGVLVLDPIDNLGRTYTIRYRPVGCSGIVGNTTTIKIYVPNCQITCQPNFAGTNISVNGGYNNNPANRICNPEVRSYQPTLNSLNSQVSGIFNVRYPFIPLLLPSWEVGAATPDVYATTVYPNSNSIRCIQIDDKVEMAKTPINKEPEFERYFFSVYAKSNRNASLHCRFLDYTGNQTYTGNSLTSVPILPNNTTNSHEFLNAQLVIGAPFIRTGTCINFNNIPITNPTSILFVPEATQQSIGSSVTNIDQAEFVPDNFSADQDLYSPCGVIIGGQNFNMLNDAIIQYTWTEVGSNTIVLDYQVSRNTAISPPNSTSNTPNGQLTVNNLLAVPNFPLGISNQIPSVFVTPTTNTSYRLTRRIINLGGIPIDNFANIDAGAIGGPGVFSSDVMNVIVPTNNSAIPVLGTPTFCQGQSTTLTTPGGSSYLWSTGETTASIIASTVGTYSLTFSNQQGCTASASVNCSIDPTCCSTSNFLTIGINQSSVTNFSDLLIANPTLVSQQSSTSNFTVNGKNFHINGTLNVDVDALLIINSSFKMGAGARIQVNTDRSLTLRKCLLSQGCGSFWKGIVTQEDANSLTITGGCVIEDAETAVELRSGVSVNISGNQFTNNIIGIYSPVFMAQIPPTGAINNHISWLSLSANSFSTNKDLRVLAAYLGQVFKPSAQGGNALWYRGLAGIYLNDATTVPIGSAAGAPNVFTNLMNGVILRRTNANLQNFIFSNIQRDWGNASSAITSSPLPSGWAVHSIGGSAVSQLTMSGSPMTGTISNCLSGIWSQNQATTISGLTIQVWGTPMGSVFPYLPVVQTDGRAISAVSADTRVMDNTITAATKCILVSSANTRMIISGNHLNVNNFSWGTGIEVQGTQAPFVPTNTDPATLTHKIEGNNPIQLLGGSIGNYGVAPRRGILVNASQNIAVINNHIIANTSAFNSAINITGCDYINMQCNKIEGVSAFFGDNTMNASFSPNNHSCAVKVESSSNTTVSCNKTFDTRTGYRFNGACNGTVFSGNELGEAGNPLKTHRLGLHVSPTATIGGQDNAGNIWHAANYDIWGAVNQGGIGLPLRFKISPFVTPNTPPNGANGLISVGVGLSPTPDVFGSWFTSQQANPNMFTCGSSASIACAALRPASANTFDEALAQGDIPINEYPTEVNWTLDKALFEKIAENPSEFQDDPILMAFYNAQLAHTLGQLNESDEKASDVEKASLATESLLEAKKIAVTDAEVELEIKDAELALAASEEEIAEIMEDKKALYDDLAVKMQEALAAEALKRAETDLKATEGIAYTNQIATNMVYETNLKTVNNIFFETIGKGIYTFTEAQWTVIDNMALQCPISGGPGVYKARALYALNANRNYSDDETCLSQGVLLRESKPSDRVFNLTPNPNDGNFIVQWDKPLAKGQTASVTVTDLLGKVIAQTALSEENTYYVFQPSTPLANGFYFCRVSIEGSEIYVSKVIVSH